MKKEGGYPLSIHTSEHAIAQQGGGGASEQTSS